jgi:hypothetical protein
MRDLDKERELAGLAPIGKDEARAAERVGGADVPGAEAKPSTKAAKGHRSPVGGDPASDATSPADDAIAELLRLGQDAAAHAAKLTKRVNPVAGVPDRHWRKNKLQLARNAAADMVERLLAFLDHVAGDPDLEEDDPGGGDPCDTVGHGSEGDEIEIRGEQDLGWTECIDQRHIGQGDTYDRDGEMNLASLEGIDQRFAWTGSRTDREVDPFPYAEPARKGFTEPTSHARAETEAELRKRGLGDRSSEHGNIVELVRWRR